MVAFPQLILTPVHARMDESVYTNLSCKFTIDLKEDGVFTFVDPSLNDTTDPRRPAPSHR